MSPRSTPTLARIARLIVTPAGMTEEMILQEIAGWDGPANGKPHWIWGGKTRRDEKPMVWNGTQPEHVCRVIFAAIYNQPLRRSWLMTRVCEEPSCVSPFHRQPKATRGPDGYVEKLPGVATRETVDDLVKLLRAGWSFEKLIEQGKDLTTVVDASMIYDEEA